MASRAVKAVGGVLGVIVVLGVVVGGLAATGTFAKPTVESTSYQWGKVTNESTEIETTVVVANPNPVGVPGVVDVSYEAQLNDVTLAQNTRSGVGFGTGENTLELTAQMQNEKISQWWVTHVNNGEQSTLSIDATVSAPGFSRKIPATSSTIETSLLDGFTTDETRTVTFREDPFLRITDQQAQWGTANASTSPIQFSSTVENVHNYSVSLDGVEYIVRMNGVELGRERTTTGVSVAPGETGSLDVTVGLDTPRMADWWAAHVRDGEVSNLSVEMYGLVRQDGQLRRIPIRFFDKTLQLETNMLGGGETSVEALDQSGSATRASVPTVGETSQQWGAITDSRSEIITQSTLDVPQQGINELMNLTVSQRTTINGIEVATGRQTISAVEAGQIPIRLVSQMDNEKVPRWWARHVNSGEQSRVVTTPTATADVEFTKFDVQLARRTTTTETNMLAGLNGNRNERVTANGRTVATITGVSAAWNEATPRTAPIDVRATVRNERRVSLEVTEIEYRVQLNDVTLADRTVSRSTTIPGSSTRTVSVPMRLNTQRMDEWWVQHVRDGERSRLNVTVWATVENRLGSERVRLDSLGQNTVVETNMLGGGS